MIKLNEVKLLELINTNDLEALKLLIGTEVYNTSLSSTDKKRINAFRKFSKARSKEFREGLKGAYVDNDNMMTVCDGYRIARLFDSNIKDCLMVQKESVKDVTSKLINDTKSTNQLQIQLDANDIMLQYKKYKATKDKKIESNNHGIYVVAYEGFLKEECYIVFNIEYLKEFHDIFDFTSEVEFYIQDKSIETNFFVEDGAEVEALRTNNSPLYIESDNGNGIILPIRPTTNPKLIIENNKK